MSLPQLASNDARAARRAADREQSAAAIAELQTSEGWQRWLRVRRAFHRYSFNNQVLIAMQMPDATKVAGFRTWLTLGYCVRKGEKAIRIWVPMAPSKKAIQAWKDAGCPAGEKPRTGFKLGPVFDRSQVEAQPGVEQAELDAPLVDIYGDALGGLLEVEIPALAEDLGVDFALTDAPWPAHQGARGWFVPSTKTIRVRAERSLNAQVATAVHELAHAVVHLEPSDGDPTLDYATEELVVESVSYTVLGALGIDTAGKSIPYLASWAETSSVEAIEQHARLIDRVARRIEDTLIPAADRSNAPATVAA